MDTAVRAKFLTLADIVMRVPLLFIIDEILIFEHKLIREGAVIEVNDQVELQISNGYLYPKAKNHLSGSEMGIDFEHVLHMTYLTFTVKCLCCWLGGIAAICSFMLCSQHLVVVYLYLMSVGAVFLSYSLNAVTMKAIIAYVSTHESTTTTILDDILSLNLKYMLNEGPGLLIIQNYILQCLLAYIFCYVHFAPRHPNIQKLLVLSFLAPSILGICPLPTQVLHHTPGLAALFPLIMCKYVIWHNGDTMLRIMYASYQHAMNFISDFGLSALAETVWIRLNVPCVLRTFWMLRVGGQVIQFLGNHYGEETFTYNLMIRTLLVNGCETFTALLGMTSIISFICHYIGCFFDWVLLTGETRGKSIGTMSAILFYALALQTSLTTLDAEKRFIKLCRNFCLLFTAILHFVHNIVNPLLMSLSASHNPALHRHIRALGVCVFLILSPVSLLTYLWSNWTVSTWLIAVSLFSIEVIVKVVVSLAIYSLFLVGAYSSVRWEQLDDCVYVIKTFGNTVEFAFGIIMFFNGFWILVYESGGAVRAIMICIHAYFNIWCEAKVGWSVFMKRRSAVNKINSLPIASVKQLRMLNDVCAICYQEMRCARITRCNHYFHGDCLRKWLYVQDSCPLCHDVLYNVENVQNKENEVTSTEQQIPVNEGTSSSVDQ